MAKNRPGTILYALGMTQHTTGVQGIRGFTILQLLLGNIGKPGSGVNALRGEPNVQGACDMGVLNNYLPGYMDYPSAHRAHAGGVDEEERDRGPPVPGEHAQGVLRRRGDPRERLRVRLAAEEGAAKNYSTLSIFEDALAGKMKLVWIVGQNPAVTIAQLKMTFDGLDKSRRSSSRRSGKRRRRPSGSVPARTRRPSRPRCSCCRRPSSWRRTGPSRNSGGWSSGDTPPSSRRGRQSPTARSWTTSSGACAIWSTSRGTRGTRSSRRLPGRTSPPRTC